MENISSIHLQRLHGRLGEVVYELTRVRSAQFGAGPAWQPAVNAYLCTGQITLCVDLAGVDREALEIRAEIRRVSIRGRRELPEPGGKDPETLRILAMEIDYGSFERQIELPVEVDTRRVAAEQRNGLLWVYLPLLPES